MVKARDTNSFFIEKQLTKIPYVIITKESWRFLHELTGRRGNMEWYLKFYIKFRTATVHFNKKTIRIVLQISVADLVPVRTGSFFQIQIGIKGLPTRDQPNQM
jgi:hypothetical protein